MKWRLASLLCSVFLSAYAHAASKPPLGSAQVHQFTTGPDAILVNGYIIETERSLIVVDATLTVSSAAAFRRRIEALNKPLVAVVITHAHPDHYNGLAIVNSGIDAPVYATREVLASIQAIDGPKEAQWRPVFGAEWPSPRAFPTQALDRRETLMFDGVYLRVTPLGPAESHADSIWTVNSAEGRSAFVGDLVFSGTHAYACDGHANAWLSALGDLKQRSEREQWRAIYPGHGAPWIAGPTSASPRAYIQRQVDYLTTFRERARAALPDGISTTESADIQRELEQRFGVQGIEFLVGACAQTMAANE